MIRRMLVALALFSCLALPAARVAAAGPASVDSASSTIDAADTDNDGLSDYDEVNLYHTNPGNPDTDGDGFSDGLEVQNGYDPLLPGKARLQKEIVVNLKEQELRYYLGPKMLGAFQISTGKASTKTPKGTFAIVNKSPRAWSKSAGLWMPWWMSFIGTQYGIHELPEWPNGYKEGADHLGTPVSHGCVRLGVGPAKVLYDWAEIGTKVVVE